MRVARGRAEGEVDAPMTSSWATQGPAPHTELLARRHKGVVEVTTASASPTGGAPSVTGRADAHTRTHAGPSQSPSPSPAAQPSAGAKQLKQCLVTAARPGAGRVTRPSRYRPAGS